MGNMTSKVANSVAKAMLPLARDLVFLKAEGMVQDDYGGWVPGGPPTEYPCKGWVADYDDLAKIAGARIVNGRKLVILAHTLTATPAISDTVQDGADLWTVHNVQTDQSGAAWELEVTR